MSADAKSENRFKLTIGYEGTVYSGWQVQPNGLAVQEVLERELSQIVNHAVKVHGSGRTDSGVHARAQVAHVDLETRMSALQVMRALNARLPDDVRVMDARTVHVDFHARRSALRKEYRYFIWDGEVLPPHERLYVAHVRSVMDERAMQVAADLLVGEHDFASFTASSKQGVKSTVRTVYDLRVNRRGRKIMIRAVGSGFLYKMVRSLAGWLICVGRGDVSPESTREVLAAAERTARVPTAPGKGLFLWKVSY